MFDKKMWLEWIGNKMENDVAQKEARNSYDCTQSQSCLLYTSPSPRD